MNSNENWEFKIVDILERLHPENWDMVDGGEGNEKYTFYIHYPSITITNSKNQSHDIKDLYVRFGFYENSKFSDLSGTRTTLSQAERESKYSHSHLSSTVCTDSKFGGFCFGSGPIASTIAEMQMNEFEEMYFEGFLHELNNYLQWESLEGTPYKYFSSISRNTGIVQKPSLNVKRDLYERFVGKYKHVDFTIQKSPPEVRIDIMNLDFMRNISSLMKETGYDQYLVNVNFTTNEFSTGGASTIYEPTEIEGFIYKGKQMFQKTIYDEHESEREKFPERSILEYISRRLERKILLQALSKRESIGGDSNSCVIGGLVVQNIYSS